MENKLGQANWVFMGTPQIAVDFLTCLRGDFHLSPTLIITKPDQPQGRSQSLTPSPAKVFAQEHNIPVETPDNPSSIVDQLQPYDFICVLAYGSLLDQTLLDAPRFGTVNIHPSLLPRYRGPSPITSAILKDEKHTGVTLMKVNLTEMDAGPIIAQASVEIAEWEKYDVHERQMARLGAQLFCDHMDEYLSGHLIPQEQNHQQASYCRKYGKADMEIDPTSDPYTQYRSYCAFSKPFYYSQGKRCVVSQAEYHNKEFIIHRIIPEGRVERPLRQVDKNTYDGA